MKKTILIAIVILITIVSIVQAPEVIKGLTLALENVVVSPDKITADSNFTFTANIRNVADREFYAVRLTLQGGFPFSKTSPIYSIYVGTLKSDEAYPISFNLKIDKDAEAKEYPLKIVATYYAIDPSIVKIAYVTHEETLTSTITVEKGVDIGIERTEFPQKLVSDMKDVPIYVYVKNTGSKTAREVKLTLAAVYPFIPTGKSFFIDEIKPDEIKQAVFHVDVDSAASSQIYPIDLFIEWKENDIAYSVTKSFGIPVEKGSGIPSFINNTTIGLSVIAIVAVGFIMVRRFGKRKK